MEPGRLLALLRICPYCTAGRVPYNGEWTDPDAEMVPCHRCGGTGDLLGWLLLSAYRAGRDEAVGEVQTILSRGAEALERAPVGPSHLTIRGKVGLPL
jgi:hypothetical protein